MAFDIYRLLVDWPETVAAFRAYGGCSYFWDVLDDEGGIKVAFIRWYEGPLANFPSRREGHIGNHRMQLEAAAKGGHGLVGLLSE